MLKRTHQKDDAASVAIYSECERYRYSLTRVWDETGGKVHFVMLNPSTATEVQNDPPSNGANVALVRWAMAPFA